MLFMTWTASTGYSPAAVSPESIIGVGAVQDGVIDVGNLGPRGARVCQVIDSSIWVAVITGFARIRLQSWMMRFWMRGHLLHATSRCPGRRGPPSRRPPGADDGLV
jgi:hypothetical protein